MATPIEGGKRRRWWPDCSQNLAKIPEIPETATETEAKAELRCRCWGLRLARSISLSLSHSAFVPQLSTRSCCCHLPIPPPPAPVRLTVSSATFIQQLFAQSLRNTFKNYDMKRRRTQSCIQTAAGGAHALLHSGAEHKINYCISSSSPQHHDATGLPLRSYRTSIYLLYMCECVWALPQAKQFSTIFVNHNEWQCLNYPQQAGPGGGKVQGARKN